MTGPFEDPAFLAAEAYYLTPPWDTGEAEEMDAEEMYDMREDELREKHLGLWDEAA